MWLKSQQNLQLSPHWLRQVSRSLSSPLILLPSFSPSHIHKKIISQTHSSSLSLSPIINGGDYGDINQMHVPEPISS